MGYVKVRLLPFKVLVRPSCKGGAPGLTRNRSCSS